MRRGKEHATQHVAGVTDASCHEIAWAPSDNDNRLRGGLPPLNCVILEAIKGGG
ncbi:MAG: hypothetical protein IIC81_02025 [Chloroflexi bacterium]|nr:hypothetical protein [Chloroflexota bacterium]